MSGLAQFWKRLFPLAAKDVGYTTSISSIEQPEFVFDEEQVGYTESMDYKEWKTSRNSIIKHYIYPRLLVLKDPEEKEDCDNENNNNNNNLERSSSIRSLRRVGVGGGLLDTQEMTEEVTNNNQLANSQNHHNDDPQASSAKAKVLSLDKPIPHVSETLNEVSIFSHVDMYTKVLNLNLVCVDKIWKFRDTRRPEIVDAIPRCHMVVGDETLLPRFLFSNTIDDGPLSTVYRYVMSFDIIQLEKRCTNPTARAAAAVAKATSLINNDDDEEDDLECDSNDSKHHINSMKSRRMRVFFYNSYAKKLNDLLQDVVNEKSKQQQKMVILSLQNIPARCIMPHSVTEWFDRHEMIDYCLCIGDESTMREEVEDGENMRRIRFDSTGKMEIRVAVIDSDDAIKSNSCNHQQTEDDEGIGTNNQFQERLLTNHNNNKILETPSLIGAYKEWKKSHREEGQQQQQREKVASLETNEKSLIGEGVEDIDSESSKDANSSIETIEHIEPNARKNTNCNQNIKNGIENHRNRQRPKEQHTSSKKRKKPNGKIDTINKGLSGAVMHTNTTHFGSARKRKSDTHSSEKNTKKVKATIVKYLKMGDLQKEIECSHNSRDLQANVFGVVVGFSSPFQTKHGDWMITVSVVDESLNILTRSQRMKGHCDNGGKTNFEETDSVPDSITVLIFCKKKDAIPKLAKAGDVIRLHRVYIQMYQGKIQLVGKQGSSHVIFRGCCNFSDREEVYTDTSYNWHYISNSESFTNTEEHQLRFKLLWKWGQQRLRDYPTINSKQKTSISNMKLQKRGSNANFPERQPERNFQSNSYLDGDLTVMVAAIIPVPLNFRNSTVPVPRGFLRVWDGTGMSISDPIPPDTIGAREALKNGDPPTASLVKIASIISHFNKKQKNLPTLEAPTALRGRVVNATIWENSHWNFLVTENLKVGNFIRLRNVREANYPSGSGNGVWSLTVHDKSWLTPLSDISYDVFELLKDHNQRILRKESANPQSGLLPLYDDKIKADHAQIENNDHANSTNGITNSKSADDIVVSNKNTQCTITLATFCKDPTAIHFSGIVYFVRIIPGFAATIDDLCAKDKNGNTVYRFALRVNDDSTENGIDAIVSNDIGQTVLGGMTALEACRSDSNSSSTTTGHPIITSLRSNILSKVRWKVAIRSIFYQVHPDKKYFVVDSIKKLS